MADTNLSNDIFTLYKSPFPSSRNGALFNAFSYPTKISPEVIALFIACHTKINDTIFDPFGGSGTTGIATMLCDKPTQKMKDFAEDYQLSPLWGPRKAIIQELSPIGSAIGDVLCHTSPKSFLENASSLIARTEKELDGVYSTINSEGTPGKVRYTIWSDVVRCPHCGKELTYAEIAVDENPVRFKDKCKCPYCHNDFDLQEAENVHINVYDPVLKQNVSAKKRVPFKIYGTSNGKKWQRLTTAEDIKYYNRMTEKADYSDVPIYKLKWGELYRKGYHFGIEYLHQMYTLRNVLVFSKLWKNIKLYPVGIQKALKVFLLSYNQSHSTLMTRVVAKKNSKDFVITGAQPGVLYISSLPVEKNIFEGLRRKLKTFASALELTEGSRSEVTFKVADSVVQRPADSSIDYVFTDPPFGDYIPYSEINQINEGWLNKTTDDTDEVIINSHQDKAVNEYKNLMTEVFQNVHRSLKKDGLCTVVFHSAKSEIWRSIMEAYQNSHLGVVTSGILDKQQASFKQVNSTITVKGDPMVLLRNDAYSRHSNESDEDIAKIIIRKHNCEKNNKVKSERMFSEYISSCISRGVSINLDANYFFHS